MSSKENCIRCGKAGAYKCSRCKQVSYCSKQCQTDHWKSGHKGECQVLSQSATPKQFIAATPSSPVNLYQKITSQEVIKREEVPVNDCLFPPKRVQQLMYFRPSQRTIGVGLQNAGNTCFLNAVLQCFTYTNPLAVWLESEEHNPKTCKITSMEAFCMQCALQQQVNNLLHSEYTVQNPLNILFNLREIGDFRLFQQEDAHDFAYSVLGAVHRNILKNLDVNVDMKREETTIIYQIFGGYMQSLVKCVSCGFCSTSFESFLDLSLELSSGSSVEEALQTYTTIEHLDQSVGWKCEKCAKPVAAQKQLTINKAPNVLMLTLKRFDVMRGGGKINKSVVFREQLSLARVMSPSTDDKDTDYELYAIIVHYGPTIFSGHYVAFIKIENQWLLFDDDKVQIVSASVVLKQNAYMLYYQKVQNDKETVTQQSAPSQVAASVKRADKGKNPLASSDQIEISSTSTATATQLQTPNSRYYVREVESDGNSVVKDIVVKIEVPLLLSNQGALLTVATNGSVQFEAKGQYKSITQLPFNIQTEAVTAEWFRSVGVVICTIPVLDTSNIPAQTKSVPVTLQESATKLREMESTLESELIVEEQQNEFKPKASKQESNVEVASYSKLYTEIDKNGKSAAKIVSEKAKVGRNDDCPCGSGKKYKKCHGK